MEHCAKRKEARIHETFPHQKPGKIFRGETQIHEDMERQKPREIPRNMPQFNATNESTKEATMITLTHEGDHWEFWIDPAGKPKTGMCIGNAPSLVEVAAEAEKFLRDGLNEIDMCLMEFCQQRLTGEKTTIKEACK